MEADAALLPDRSLEWLPLALCVLLKGAESVPLAEVVKGMSLCRPSKEGRWEPGADEWPW